MRHSLLSDLICMHVMDALLVPANVKGTADLKILTSFTHPYSVFSNLYEFFLSVKHKKISSFPYVLCSKVIQGLNNIRV